MKNLLINNAYHVLGLDTSVDQRVIAKRSKDIVKLIQIDELPEYDLDINSPKIFRTEASVKEAVQKLALPKKQIKEYFFWFNISDEVDEQVVKLLKEKNYEGAVDVWSKKTNGNSIRSLLYKKNLAILHCLLMLKNNNQEYLNTSLSNWSDVLNSTKFWPAFNKGYKMFDELNTNQETLIDFEKKAMGYVSDLYTEIAEKHDDNEYISQFSKMFNIKGDKTSKTILSPIFNRMTHAIEKLENLKVADDDILDEDESALIKDNVTIIQNSCNELVEIGLYDDSQSKVVRNRAAAALRSIIIDLHNQLGETSVALGLGKIADQISGTEGFKNKIQEDVKQLQKSHDHDQHLEKFEEITEPILADYKKGNTKRALDSINNHLYNTDMDESLKKELKDLKELMEKRIAKHGIPGKTPSLGTLNTVGFRMYGDTNYFSILFIPLIPISRWSCEDLGAGQYNFMGKLELTKAQGIWQKIAIAIIIILIISAFV